MMERHMMAVSQSNEMFGPLPYGRGFLLFIL